MSQKCSSAIGSARPARMDQSGFPLLVSYHYMRKWSHEDIEEFLSDEGVEYMLDSGAFSAKNCGAEIHMGEYLKFLGRYGDRFKGGYVALDKLGDPKQTRINLDIMHSEGFSPMPVHVWGDDEKKMDELFERSNKVCLGGFKRPGRGPAPKVYVTQKMRWAKGRDVHWLGYTNQDMLTALLPHSCDSSSWTFSVRLGHMFAYVGNGYMAVYRADQRHDPPVSKSKLNELLAAAGVSMDRHEDVEAWRGDDGVNYLVTIVSWVRYVMDLREKFGVRYNLAFTRVSSGRRLREAIVNERARRSCLR